MTDYHKRTGARTGMKTETRTGTISHIHGHFTEK